MLLTALLAIALGQGVTYHDSCVRQSRAVAQLRSVHADVAFSYAPSFWHRVFGRNLARDVISITLRSDDVDPRPTLDLRAFRKLKRLTLDGLWSRSYLPQVLELRCLEELEMTYADLCDDDVKALLLRLPLRELNVDRNPRIGGSLDGLVASPNLKRLLLRQTGIRNDDLRNLAKCCNLEEIDLSGTKVDDEGLKYLASLKALKQCGLGDTYVRGRGISSLATLKGLQGVTLTSTLLDEAFLADVTFPAGLKYLSVGSTRFGSQGLRQIAALTDLEMLDLSETRLKPGDLTQLLPLKRLKILYIDGLPIDDRDVDAVSQLKELRWLMVGGTPLNDKHLPVLGRLASLKLLGAGGTGITEGAAVKFSKERGIAVWCSDGILVNGDERSRFIR